MAGTGEGEKRRGPRKDEMNRGASSGSAQKPLTLTIELVCARNHHASDGVTTELAEQFMGALLGRKPRSKEARRSMLILTIDPTRVLVRLFNRHDPTADAMRPVVVSSTPKKAQNGPLTISSDPMIRDEPDYHISLGGSYDCNWQRFKSVWRSIGFGEHCQPTSTLAMGIRPCGHPEGLCTGQTTESSIDDGHDDVMSHNLPGGSCGTLTSFFPHYRRQGVAHVTIAIVAPVGSSHRSPLHFNPSR